MRITDPAEESEAARDDAERSAVWALVDEYARLKGEFERFVRANPLMFKDFHPEMFEK